MVSMTTLLDITGIVVIEIDVGKDVGSSLTIQKQSMQLNQSIICTD